MCMDAEVTTNGLLLKQKEKRIELKQPKREMRKNNTSGLLEPQTSSKPSSALNWSPLPWSPSSPIPPSLVSSPTSSVSLASSLPSDLLYQLEKSLPSLQIKSEIQSKWDKEPPMVLKPPLQFQEHKKSREHLQPDSKLQFQAQLQSQSQTRSQPPSQSQPRPAGLTLVRIWLFYIMVPIALVAWVETQSVIIAAATAVIPFVWAICQGIVGLLKFRLLYGNSPHPAVPCHGVVIVDPEDRTMALPSSRSSSSVCLKSSSPKDIHYISERSTDNNQTESPLRLLVIGDSLAIGVGQKKFSTPIMPEVISKTLSKAMGGRAVYWSCHGKPGASTSWIIRELERGVQRSEKDRNTSPRNDKDFGVEGDKHEKIFIQDIDCLAEDTLSDCSDSTDMDALSLFGTYSDTSSEDDYHTPCHQQQQKRRQDEKQQVNGEQRTRSAQVWKERLREHGKRFNPEAEVLGPYDVVVVLTGGNDLKNALLPNFLFKNQDKELIQQAKKSRGYDSELRKVLDTLYRKMKVQYNTIRKSALHCCCKQQMEITKHCQHEREQKNPGFPLVVLPGMPAQLLPVFRKRPLHWLAIPAVAIMDFCKRNLASSLPGKVLFIEANTMEDLHQYKAQQGSIWEQRIKEETLLSIKDIDELQSSCIEESMKIYHEQKQKSLLAKLFQDTSPIPSDDFFSADGVHANDEGYDIWGRTIAAGIIRELETRNA